MHLGGGGGGGGGGDRASRPWEGQEEVEGKAGEHDQDRLLMGVFPVPCGG